MQISHEEARTLIQFNADEALDANRKGVLRSHLDDCAECRSHADRIKETEAALRNVISKNWGMRPVPLSINAKKELKSNQGSTGMILATRTMMIGIAFTMFVIAAWQLMQVTRGTPGQSPLGILPVPTPSTQFTATTIKVQNCEEVRYRVRENDTLESIADHFSTSKEVIMSANSMETETINTTMELNIPLCDTTPTGTVHAPTLTTTHTPEIDVITTTPG